MEYIKGILSFIIAILITAGIGRLFSETEMGAATVFVAFGILLGAFFIAFIVVDKLFNTATKTARTLKDKINYQKEINELQQLTNAEIKKYSEAKNSFVRDRASSPIT